MIRTHMPTNPKVQYMHGNAINKTKQRKKKENNETHSRQETQEKYAHTTQYADIEQSKYRTAAAAANDEEKKKCVY